MSASSKYGRGGGRGPTRMVPPPLGRGMVPLRKGPAPGKDKSRSEEVPPKGRGGLAGKGSVVGGSSAGSSFQEENFQLVSCAEGGVVPLYAMAIRLTPGLLETLKRVEELGETTTMKFGVNPSGHVIKVGEEEFRFSSAPEPGHLCDIFEEQRRGEDGAGLLVEAGAVWRKLAVKRTLSTTEMDRVKARSVEAERLQKSRKAIILDHSNGLMNNKVASSGDVNGRRAPPIIKTKQEPPQKKRKITTRSPVVPPAPALKPRPVAPVAERLPVSAVPPKLVKTTVASSPEPPSAPSRGPSHGAVAPPLKSRSTSVEEVGPSTATKAMPPPQKDKGSSSALAAGNEGGSASKTAGVVNLIELRNCLITLLTENPKGMTIKAVEKALGEAMPNVRVDKRQIEKVIKAIASYHAPGKYMLKEGVEKGVFAKPSPGSGSSPDTVPMDSPPLADSPAIMEVPAGTPQDTGGNADNSLDRGGAPSHQDGRRPDGSNRSSSLPVQRGGESAMSRAIRKATEITRGNAERLHPSGHDKERIVTESPVQKLEDGSSAPEEMVVIDHVSTAGDEIPVASATHKENEVEVEKIHQDVQKPVSPSSHAVNHKKENSDGSDSSSSSASDSDSDTDQESDSDSESGSGSGSGSESDSDGSSSSGSEEENMDEDVDIISDDEDKAGEDMTEASKQKLKPKDVKTSLQRQESRAQKQASRAKDHLKKQKHRTADAGMTPHGSEDVDIGDGAEAGEIGMGPVLETVGKRNPMGGLDSNVEVDVDVVSCDGGIHSPQDLAGFGKPDINDTDNVEIMATADPTEVEQGQVSMLTLVQPQGEGGSESEHSIEEYETRAENSGVRGTRANVVGGQKDHSFSETTERRAEGSESVLSPVSKGLSGVKRTETLDRVERESKSEVGNLGTVSDSRTFPKEQPVSLGVSLRSDNTQRSTTGTPILGGDGLEQSQTDREGPIRGKGVDSKKKDVSSIGRLNKNLELGEIQEKRSEIQRGPQRISKAVETSIRSAKSTGAALKPSGETEISVKSWEGAGKLSKLSEDPGLAGKGPLDMMDSFPSDPVVKSAGDVDTLQRPDVQRRQNRDAGLLSKPGKGSEAVGRTKDNDQNGGLSREKDGHVLGRPGRESKQGKKPLSEKLDGLRRSDIPERAGLAPQVGEKTLKDAETQRKKSPKDVELGSRIASDNEIHTVKGSQRPAVDLSEARGSILGGASDTISAKDRIPRVSSDLELGELRDIVAGEELRGKDSLRNEPVKGRESSDLSSRQPSNKALVSPEKEKPRTLGKQGAESKKPSQADIKKQQLAKRDLQKVEASLSSRDTVRPVMVQKSGGDQEDRVEIGSNRVLDAAKTKVGVHDTNEKLPDGRTGKRLAEESGHYDHGRFSKRLAVEQPQVSASLARGEPDTSLNKPEKGSSVLDTTGKASATDSGKGLSTEGWNQQVTYSGKATVENGRVLGLKSKGHEVSGKDGERGGLIQESKPRTSVGLLGPGAKKETSGGNLIQSNGKKRSTQIGDVQGRDFFALHEKRIPDLKGSISNYDQYLEYCKEYNEKYPVYVRLNTVLESDKEDFENFSRDISIAKTSDDKNKLGSIYGKVRKDYLQCRKRFKRMQKTFSLLHDELRVIKQRCKEYAEKVGQG